MINRLNKATQLTTLALLATVAALGTGCGKSDNNTSQASVIAGLSIAANDLVTSDTANICANSSHAGDQCYFNGGQRVIYSDGSVLLTGLFEFLNNTSQDTDQNTISVIIPPYINTSYQTLSSHVDLGFGDNKLFLSYTRSPELIQLVYDSNGNGKLDGNDAVVFTAPLYHW